MEPQPDMGDCFGTGGGRIRQFPPVAWDSNRPNRSVRTMSDSDICAADFNLEVGSDTVGESRDSVDVVCEKLPLAWLSRVTFGQRGWVAF